MVCTDPKDNRETPTLTLREGCIRRKFGAATATDRSCSGARRLPLLALLVFPLERTIARGAATDLLDMATSPSGPALVLPFAARQIIGDSGMDHCCQS